MSRRIITQADVDAHNAQFIEITRAEHERLIERDAFLSALQAAGVDNWEGYSEACRALGDEEDDDEA